MVAKFGKSGDGARKRPAEIRPALLGSLRFKGPILAGFVVASTIFAVSYVFSWFDLRQQAEESGELLVRTAESVYRGARLGMERQSQSEVDSVLRRILNGHPELSVIVESAEDQILAKRGPHAGHDKELLTGMVPAGHGLAIGTIGDQRMVEYRLEKVDKLLGKVGGVWVRQPLQQPAWLSIVLPVAAGAGVYAALLAWVFLARSLRVTRPIIKALGRVAKEEYWHRVPEGACAELVAVGRATNAALTALESAHIRVSEAYVDLAEALARTVEAKDHYTSGHSQRVARLAVEMGEWLGFDKDRLEMLYHGGLLHDIGKMATPDRVLLKPGPLDDEEFEEMKKHPMNGDRILGKIPGMRDIADIARSHHERWDGDGYPLGQAGSAIPLEGRIVAIADAYDAMVTKRSYKPAMPIAKALEIIEKDGGTHFDPELAKLFVKMKRAGKGYKALQPEPGESEGLPPGRGETRPARVDHAAGGRETGVSR